MLSKRTQFLLRWVAAVAVTGCLASPVSTVGAERAPLGREIPAYRAPSRPGPPEPSRSTQAEPEGELRLEDALALALLHNPRLAGTSWDVRMAEARTLQARLFPNPEIEVEVEGAPGSSRIGDFKADETTVRLSQLLELGGKRPARTRLAAMEEELANWNYETERLAVLTNTRLDFIDVLTAQERLRLAEDLVALSEQMSEAVGARVRAGKVSPLEASKADVELAKSRLELERARARLEAARMRLAGAWASASPRFLRASGSLSDLREIPSFDVVQADAQHNPEIARWGREMKQRRAALSLEKAKRVPNAVLSAGARRFEYGDYDALTFEAGFEIPLFDRNQGGIREAQYRLAKAAYEKKDVELRATVALAEAYEELTTARLEALGLRREVVPAADHALRAAREGYQWGKFDYMVVLDAQRTFFQANAELVDALSRYHRYTAIVEGLLGTGLDSLNGIQREREGNDNGQ
ncbi:MAG: TolC family protein [Candidatus Eiseniibacteriota bacterium]|nr:MAG: TolC family protein [Candidatus Eisenbacteria bacterium]